MVWYSHSGGHAISPGSSTRNAKPDGQISSSVRYRFMLVSDGGRLPGGADLRPGLYVRIDPEADVDQLRDSVAIAERLAAHEALLVLGEEDAG